MHKEKYKKYLIQPKQTMIEISGNKSNTRRGQPFIYTDKQNRINKQNKKNSFKSWVLNL